jgi:putative transposase
LLQKSSLRTPHAFSRVLPRRSWHVFVVRPETLLRSHRRLVAKRWTYPHRSLGRPTVDEAVRQLILKLARENTSWGYVRSVGELRKLGVDVSATLVRNVLSAAGVPPAPQRDLLAWRSFVRQHAATILACDFFTVDTVLLRRLYVLAFICVGTRRIEYVACRSNPDGAWMLQRSGSRRLCPLSDSALILTRGSGRRKSNEQVAAAMPSSTRLEGT